MNNQELKKIFTREALTEALRNVERIQGKIPRCRVLDYLGVYRNGSHSDYLMEVCIEYGLAEAKDFMYQEIRKKYKYRIDVRSVQEGLRILHTNQILRKTSGNPTPKPFYIFDLLKVMYIKLSDANINKVREVIEDNRDVLKHLEVLSSDFAVFAPPVQVNTPPIAAKLITVEPGVSDLHSDINMLKVILDRMSSKFSKLTLAELQTITDDFDTIQAKLHDLVPRSVLLTKELKLLHSLMEYLTSTR